MALYELLHTERPSHWFSPPTVVIRPSGMECVLYADVVVGMVGLDMNKVVTHVTRADLSDHEVRRFLDYAHGASLPFEIGAASVVDMVHYIKAHRDLCEQVFQCGAERTDEVFEKSVILLCDQRFSNDEKTRDVWRKSAEGMSSHDVAFSFGFLTLLSLAATCATASSPVAVRLSNFARHQPACFLTTAEREASSLPAGFVLIEVGDENEAVDEDDGVLPLLESAGTRYIVHGPSLWIRWRYIRRMFQFGSAEELAARHIRLPTDFPTVLFVFVVCTLLGIVDSPAFVRSLTPRRVAYLKEHAGEYDLVNGCGEPYPEFERVFNELNAYDWEEVKRTHLARKEREAQAAQSSAPPEPPAPIEEK